MSDQEQRRGEVMAGIEKGDLRLRSGAEMLGISYRQVQRAWQRYRTEGKKGVVHGNVGRRSNRSRRAGPASFGERCYNWCGRSIPVLWGSVLDPGKPGRNLGPAKRGSGWMQKRCGGGCWPRGYGAGSGSGRRTARGERGGRMGGNWCSWTAALRSGWRRDYPNMRQRSRRTA